jgi:hypothetical protein
MRYIAAVEYSLLRENLLAPILFFWYGSKKMLQAKCNIKGSKEKVLSKPQCQTLMAWQM